METKKKYEQAAIEVLSVECNGIICGSVETTEKTFTVKTDDYELENDSWCDGTFTFD